MLKDSHHSSLTPANRPQPPTMFGLSITLTYCSTRAGSGILISGWRPHFIKSFSFESLTYKRKKGQGLYIKALNVCVMHLDYINYKRLRLYCVLHKVVYIQESRREAL